MRTITSQGLPAYLKPIEGLVLLPVGVLILHAEEYSTAQEDVSTPRDLRH